MKTMEISPRIAPVVRSRRYRHSWQSAYLRDEVARRAILLFRQLTVWFWGWRAYATITFLEGAGGQWVDVHHRSDGGALRSFHLAFGVLLLITLNCRVSQEKSSGVCSSPVKTHLFHRSLKRLMYLLLYVLAIFKQLFVLSACLPHGAFRTLGRVTHDTIGVNVSEDFGIYILYVAAAIALIPSISRLHGMPIRFGNDKSAPMAESMTTVDAWSAAADRRKAARLKQTAHR
jgi:hypothetical protein